MADDRNQLEQEAIGHLGKGKSEEALKCYQAILRIEPRDIRIRQKIADLYLQLGKTPEAMRQLREVAIGHIGEDQHRQALVVLKQLKKLKPKDDEVHGLLGDCYKAGGFLPDAREAYETTLELLETKPKEALPYAAKVMSIAPGEMPPKINHAELLQRAGKHEAAAEAWKCLGVEARRRGNAPDQVAFNERSLRLQEDDLGCLEGAAEARIQMGEPKEALVHIQKAYAANPNSERVLSMLAQCFELMEQQPKAKKVLLQLAKLHEELNQPVGRRDALKRAFACAPDDGGLEAEVGDAVARAERFEMRLTDHKWSESKDETVGRVVVEAEVLSKYGFADRAKVVIEESGPEVRGSLAVRARMVEVLVELEDLDGAIGELGALEVDGVEDQGILEAVRTRTGALKGDFDAPEGVAPGAFTPSSDDDEDEEEVVSIDIEDDEDLDADSDGPEARGDALAAAGDTQGAMAAYQQALASDPANEEILIKLGEILGGDDDEGEAEEEVDELPAEALSPVADDDAAGEDMPDFQSIFEAGEPVGPGAAPPAGPAKTPVPVPAVQGGDAAAEVRARLLVGMYDEAIALGKEQDDLVSAVLCAEARARNGTEAAGRKALRRALDDAGEGDAGYAEALWVLARLQAVTGKAKAAVRTLDDLEDFDSAYRSAEVQALRHGIELLKGR